MEIRLLTSLDIVAAYSHMCRHIAESGENGDMIFNPLSEKWEITLEKFKNSSEQKWSIPLTEIGWERQWGIIDEEMIFGTLKLKHFIPLKSTLHKASLSMGIERSHRQKGLGSQLLSTALGWAKSQPSLEWIELGVFEHNIPARALYKKFGLKEQGRTEDLFRVKGQKINDISMAINIRENRN